MIDSTMMEMAISVVKDGKLKCELKGRQSMKEGAVLCIIDIKTSDLGTACEVLMC